MRKRKMLMYVIIILIILFILWIGFLLINNRKKQKNENISEYIPEEEITDEQLRSTNIALYFYNNKEKKIIPELRQIDSKELLENPEKKLIEYLISGPIDNNLEKLIPEGTQIIKVEKKKEILIIDFSKEFIENQNIGEEEGKYIITSILNTVTQLNEFNGIKILIEGEENKSFPNSEINFQQIFTKNN